MLLMLQSFLDEWGILHLSVSIRTNGEVVVRNYAGQLRNAEGRRNSLTQRRVQQSVIQCQISESTLKIYIYNTYSTHILKYIYTKTINEKETKNLKESKERYKGGFGRRKGKEKHCNYNLKSKK